MAARSTCSFFCICMFVIISGVLSQNSCNTYELASLNPREIVTAQCTVFQQITNPQPFCEGGIFKPRNCTAVWEKFAEAFMYQPVCNVSAERLEDFIRLTDHPVPTDKALFWENVYPWVMRFSNKGAKYVALADMLYASIGATLIWSSDPVLGLAVHPTKCPGWDATPTCPQSAQRAFWIAVSKNYALKVSGEIFIMLDADVDPIYADTTYLAVYELPYLTANVTKATVLLLNKHPVKNRNKCDDASLGVMAKLMKSKGIQYACVENRRDMALLYCLDYPQSEVCSSLTDQTSSASSVFPSVVLAVVILTYTWSLSYCCREY